MNQDAPAFPRATGALDPVRSVFEKAGKDDLSLLWSGEAASLAREDDAQGLTQRLWNEAREQANGLAAVMRTGTVSRGEGNGTNKTG
jgi:nitronate monooxygenase